MQRIHYAANRLKSDCKFCSWGSLSKRICHETLEFIIVISCFLSTEHIIFTRKRLQLAVLCICNSILMVMGRQKNLNNIKMYSFTE